MIVRVDGGEPVTDTLIIADGVNIEHRAVMLLVKKYEAQLNRGLSPFQMVKGKTAGRPIDYAILNEHQTMFLITLMRNSDIVVNFKYTLVGAFLSQRQALAELSARQNNDQWKDARKNGKVVLLQKTDVIKVFCEYATNQGSTKSSMYYMAIAKMQNKALFFLEQKYPNLREVLSIKQLAQASAADDIVEKALADGMAQEMNYKDIYKMAKERVELFPTIIGRSPVCDLLSSTTSIKIENKGKK
jgi:phage regulator Rha-like protein